jgi:hypothetical protein
VNAYQLGGRSAPRLFGSIRTSPPQRVEIYDFDTPTAVADHAGLLERVGDARDASALDAKHVAQELLSEVQLSK